MKRLDALLSSLSGKERFDGAEYDRKMRFACVLTAYVKRRSNLVMLAEKYEYIDAGELALAIKESLDYLSFAGAECSCDLAFQGRLDGGTAGVFYDFFEACVADYDNLPGAVIVRLSKRGEDVVMRIGRDGGTEYLPGFIKSKFPGYDVTVETDDEEVYCSLAVKGGAV